MNSQQIIPASLVNARADVLEMIEAINTRVTRDAQFRFTNAYNLACDSLVRMSARTIALGLTLQNYDHTNQLARDTIKQRRALRRINLRRRKLDREQRDELLDDDLAIG